ncbi:MAG: AAA family ATPase, partial [Rickettsiales bacterium]|nr:AAA family ATPase [Rickettsiales bacterium]
MISRLALTDFRSYADLFLDGLAPAVVITGANGAGKTNILEAVSMLSAGGPLRKASLDQLARIGGSGGWTVFARAGGNDIGVSFDGEKSIVANGGAATPGRLKDFARVVWMTPVQDRLFSEPGAERRRFLDGLISDFYSFYGDALGEYMGLLKSRAAILKMPRWDLAWLGATEAEIAARALSVAAMRLEFEERLNGQLDGIEISVSGLVEDAL